MELQLLPFITFLSLTLLALSHAAGLSPEAYWYSELPNTPMPKSVKDLISPEWTEDKSTSVSVGKGGVHVNTGKGGGTTVNVGHKGGVGVNTGKPGKQTNVGVGKGGVNVHTGKGTTVNVGRKGGVGVNTGGPGKGTSVGVGKGGVNVHTGHKGKPVVVKVKPGPDPFSYIYAATETQLHDDRTRLVFFLEEDLKVGTGTKSLQFSESNYVQGEKFLPRLEAEKIPFSSEKMPEILEQFDVKENSEEGEMMKKTIRECEEPGVRGEDKYCATSLESMVDFTTSKLGKNVRAISTEVDGKAPLQKYTITGVTKMKSSEAVVSHKMNYPYAVFYCHDTHTTKAYTVSMAGASGTKATAVAVCHTDTSAWNPKHLAFQVLKVKPGTVPVCHFLPGDHVVWVAAN